MMLRGGLAISETAYHPGCQRLQIMPTYGSSLSNLIKFILRSLLAKAFSYLMKVARLELPNAKALKTTYCDSATLAHF